MIAQCPDFVTQLKTHQILSLSIKLLAQEQQLKIHFNALEGIFISFILVGI